MIRSICLGVNEGEVINFANSRSFQSFVPLIEETSKDLEINVRTIRMTLSPTSIAGDRLLKLNNFASKIDEISKSVGIRWFCIPVDLFDASLSEMDFNIITQVLDRFDNLFVNLLVTKCGEIDLNAAASAANIIRDTGRGGEGGGNCFRLGASANVAPHTPFFPFSYHSGEPCFSIAVETNQIAVQVMEELAVGEGADVFKKRFSSEFKNVISRVENLANRLEKKTGLYFAGIDASFAPFPDGRNSVSKVVQAIGGSPVGTPGSVAVTAFLTSLIQDLMNKEGIRSVGFNGVMYSVMEDNLLADQSISGGLNIEQLMLLSSVCGCGIDMVPISGVTSSDTILSFIMDTASMAIRLDKPLGVRLLPIPGKLAGEITDINGDFICNSRIFHTSQQPSTGLLGRNEKVKLTGGFHG